MRWLETLIWPEHDRRRARLAAEAPTGATLVIFHSAVLAYLGPDERERFATTVRGLDARWLANEGSADGLFLVTLDGTPVARAAAHGHSLHWIS